jgi:hemerythrin-like domain-containing protein
VTSTDSSSSRSADAALHDSLSRALEQEHREIDEAIRRCADEPVPTPGARADLERAVRELRWHIYVEEELLFPPLRVAGMTGPIMVMLREHGQMWPILDALDQALGEDADQSVLPAACRELFALLERHNPKEERILYPQVDRVLGAEASNGIREFLDGGRVPADWTCQHLRPERAGGDDDPVRNHTF